jgi:hypothetical protein
MDEVLAVMFHDINDDVHVILLFDNPHHGSRSYAVTSTEE